MNETIRDRALFMDGLQSIATLHEALLSLGLVSAEKGMVPNLSLCLDTFLDRGVFFFYMSGNWCRCISRSESQTIVV